jgi:heme exporter protein D
MPDGSIYVTAAYALTVAGLLGYGVHLLRLRRRLEKRRDALAGDERGARV